MNDKDQAAIDHVASVSKHPHAEKIVEWLITGCKVKRKDSQITIEFPSWLPTVEYELIEPKPAYRVFIEPCDGEPKTLTREHYEKYRDSYDGKVEWLSDWIEYDPPKKWPTPLVERIAAIDIKAAEWIVDNWDDYLINETFTGNGRFSRNSKTLKWMFDWSVSYQGPHYWNIISGKLGE